MAFEFFPNTNFHDLNLDYILEKAQKIDDNLRYSQASADAAKASEEAAAASEDAALLSQVAAAASEAAAKDYADNIGDPVNGIVTQWLEDNITQETGYVLDRTFTNPNAAAPAGDVGDKAILSYGKLTSVDDIDTITYGAMYYCDAGDHPAHWPFANGAGRLIVFAGRTSAPSPYTKLQVAVRTSHGSERIMYRTGSSSWGDFVEVANADDLTDMISEINTLSTSAIAGEPYSPDIAWEQGGFNTPNWTKNSPSLPNYHKYIRFVTWPSLAGISKVSVRIPNGYRGYIGYRGVAAATIFTDNVTYNIPDDGRTVLNITITRTDGADIGVSEGDGVTVRFLSGTAENAKRLDNTASELEGLIVKTDPVKIGLYGASIVYGVGVSDLAFHQDGDYVDMSEIGYSNSFNKYSGNLSWAAKFAAAMTARYPNVTVENWGVSGARASNYYQYLLKSFNNNNSPINTDVDVAIIMFGNNGRNETFAANVTAFDQIVRFFTSRGVKVFFATPTPAFNTSASFVLNTYQIAQAVKAAGQVNDQATIDVFSEIFNQCDIRGLAVEYDDTLLPVLNFLNADNLHPSDTGHDLTYRIIMYLLKV